MKNVLNMMYSTILRYGKYSCIQSEYQNRATPGFFIIISNKPKNEKNQFTFSTRWIVCVIKHYGSNSC